MPNGASGGSAIPRALSERPQPYFYAPLEQRFGAGTGIALHVRAAGDPAQITASVRGELRAMDAAMPPPVIVTVQRARSPVRLSTSPSISSRERWTLPKLS